MDDGSNKMEAASPQALASQIEYLAQERGRPMDAGQQAIPSTGLPPEMFERERKRLTQENYALRREVALLSDILINALRH